MARTGRPRFFGIFEDVIQICRITEMMSGIAADAEEQRTGIEQVDAALGMVDSITQQNAALVEQASAAAQLLDEQSRDLTRQVAVFRVGGVV